MVIRCSCCTSWKVSSRSKPEEDGKEFHDVTLSVVASLDGSVDLEDEVTPENCLMLEYLGLVSYGMDGQKPFPALQLLLSSENEMLRISILSEARIMEVYGHHGEYLKTVRNELIESMDDMVVFRGDIDLEKPLTSCSIKFVGLRDPTEMWLYGIKVIPAPVDNSEEKVLEAVEQRLSEMGLKLSDRAVAFKQLVEKYHTFPASVQKSNSITNYIASNLHKMISPDTYNPDTYQFVMSSPLPESYSMHELSTKSENVDSTHCIPRDDQNNLQDAKIKPAIANENEDILHINDIKMRASASPSVVILERFDNSAQTDEEYINLEQLMKTHIDNKLEDLSKSLMENFNKKVQELEAKLMCKLDEIESFVKPHGMATS